MRSTHLLRPRRCPSLLATTITLLILAPCSLRAADPAPATPDRSQDRNLSPQERQLAGLRQALGVTDDAEWNALAPKIEKVQTLARQVRDLRDPRRADRIRVRQDNDVVPPVLADLADRAAELRQVFNDPDAPAAYIQRTLKLYREARVKADKQLAEDLATARGQLRDLVTARQELTLIMAGLLD